LEEGIELVEEIVPSGKDLEIRGSVKGGASRAAPAARGPSGGPSTSSTVCLVTVPPPTRVERYEKSA
jgi:hypothetical protein